MQKPGWKWVIVFNIVQDLPMAAIMSISALLLNGQPLDPKIVVPNILIGFLLAFVISIILPIPLISAKFAGLFGIKPHTIGESLVGGIPVCLIYTIGIGGPLAALGLAMAKQLTFSNFLHGFFLNKNFLILYAILYAVAFFLTPIAAMCANKADGK